jgi:NAD(P)-dependent dehydrogenase (short-subunit alcohol dehydrogenase family)
MNLSGKSALVTAAGSGIGEAAAVRFAKAGASVMLADKNGAAAQIVADRIIASGGTALVFEGNLADFKTVEAMVAAATKAFGRVDCAVNNVGGGNHREKEMHELNLEHFDEDFQQNFHSALYALRAELAQMLRQGGGGSIVINASIAGLGGSPLHAYGTAKHALIGLTKNAAGAYAKRGIRVNVVCPGPIGTQGAIRKMKDGFKDKWEEEFAAGTAMGRIGRPEEVANVMVFLCSDEASFVTGTVLPVDGGQTAVLFRKGAKPSESI